MKRILESQATGSVAMRAGSVMIAVTGLLAGDAVQAQQPPVAWEVSELERAFWVCDYTVSTQRVDMTTGIACVSISDELKARKFAGDFNAMLAWWRHLKDGKYRELDTAVKPTASQAPTQDGAGSR